MSLNALRFPFHKGKRVSTGIIITMAMACMLFTSGCATDAVWDRYDSAREIPRFERIEAASIDEKGQLHVRLMCADDMARTFKADVQRALEDGVHATLTLKEPHNLPASSVNVRLLTGTRGFEYRKYPENRFARRDDGGPIDYPDTVGILGPDWIRIWIIDENGHPLQLVWLPDQGPTNAGIEISTWALAVPAGLFDAVTFPMQLVRAKLSNWK